MTTIPPDTTTTVVDSATATTATTATTAPTEPVSPCDNGSYVYGYNDNGSPLFVICGPTTVSVDPPPPANYDRCLNGYTASTFQPCADASLTSAATTAQPVESEAVTAVASLRLPATGNASAPLVGGAFAALALGVVLLFARRIARPAIEPAAAQRGVA